MSKKLKVIVLTKNEEVHIERCIKSLRDLDCEIFVVDSFSDDKTVSISRELGATVLQRAWKSYYEQFNWAITETGTFEWTLRLDADEWLSVGMVQYINSVIQDTPSHVSGFEFRRRYFFLGKWVRFGGRYPQYQLRLFRTSQGVLETRMDEHVVLKSGECVRSRHHFTDDNLKSVEGWFQKHLYYAKRELGDYFDPQPVENIPPAAKIRRLVKLNLYYRSPLVLRVFIYFLFRYVVTLGFLDGIRGSIYHVMQGLIYRLIIDVLIYDKKRSMKAKQRSVTKHIRG